MALMCRPLQVAKLFCPRVSGLDILTVFCVPQGRRWKFVAGGPRLGGLGDGSPPEAEALSEKYVLIFLKITAK